MSKNFKCWCCSETRSPLFTKGFGTTNEVKLCGSCIGALAAIDSRLSEISRCGKLSKFLTADTADVPLCERREINLEDK
jgi:hypothetical protein